MIGRFIDICTALFSSPSGRGVAHRAGERGIILLFFAFLFTSCAPMVPYGDLEKGDLPIRGEENVPDYSVWWENFKDDALNALVEEALEKNSDILIATSRIKQSRAALEVARSNLMPSVFLNGGAQRNQFSVGNNIPLVPGQNRQSTTYTADFTVSYEVDLWGKLASEREVAAEELKASTYARETARQMVAAQVARSYLTLRALDRDEALVKTLLALQDREIDLQKKRRKAGLINSYDLSVVKAERDAFAAVLPPVTAAREQAEIALAEMLGRSPKELVDGTVKRGANIKLLSTVPKVPPGLDSSLLMRRPDVIAAEHMIYAAHASVNEARAKWFPSLTLSGLLGGESVSLRNIVTNAAETWSVAANLAQPISGLWTVGRRVRLAAAVREEAELTYQQAVRRAYADALSALVIHRGMAGALQQTEKAYKNLQKAASLAGKRKKAGVIDRLELLDAEQAQFDAERVLVMAQRDRALALVDVYQALGGGWEYKK